MSALDKLFKMRENYRVHCRLTTKNNMLREKRKRFMEDSNGSVQIQLNGDELPADYLQHLIEERNIEQVAQLLKENSSKIKNAFKACIKELMNLLKDQMGGQNHLQALNVMGTLFSLGREVVTYDDIGENLVMFLIDRVLTCQMKEVSVLLWVLSQMVDLIDKLEILLRLSTQYQKIWQRSPSQQFLCLLAAMKHPSLRPSAALLEHILTNCFNSQQKQEVLMDILTIIDNYLKEVIKAQKEQPFLYSLLTFINHAISSNIKPTIKPQLIELVGMVMSVNSWDLQSYFFGQPLFDQLLFRSKIDTHVNKVASVNSLTTVLLHCNQVSNQMMQTQFFNKFLNNGFDSVLVDCLNYHDPQLLLMALKGNARLLQLGVKERLKRLKLQNKLEKLQTHPNPIVFKVVELIIDLYFSDDFI